MVTNKIRPGLPKTTPASTTTTDTLSGMYSYAQPNPTPEIPLTGQPHLTSTAIPLTDDSDWLYFVLPIIVTVLIFMLVIIWICIKKRDTWHDPLAFQKEEPPDLINKDNKNVSFNDGRTCKIYVTNDQISPPYSPDKRDPLPANWYDQGSRQSCPPISKESLEIATQKGFGGTNAPPFSNQKPYDKNTTKMNNENRQNINNNNNNSNNERIFHSETDLHLLQASRGETGETEKLRLSLENVDVSKDRRYASYVILDGNECKTPKTNENTASKIRKPSVPSRISRGSFIEIHLSDLTPNSKRLSNLPPESQTLLNGENRDPNYKHTNGDDQSADVDNNNSQPKKYKQTYPLANGNGIHNGGISPKKRLPPLPDEELYNNGGLHLSKKHHHRPLTKSTSEPPRLQHNDIPFIIDENCNKSSYKQQRELSAIPTKTKNIPDIYINGEQHKSTDSRLCLDVNSMTSSHEGKLIYNGR